MTNQMPSEGGSYIRQRDGSLTRATDRPVPTASAPDTSSEPSAGDIPRSKKKDA